MDADIYEEFVNKMTYPNIADKYKIKVFDIDRNDSDIELIKSRVLVCREIQKDLLKKLP